jgi:hypothetical protein
MRREVKTSDRGGTGRDHHQTRPYRTYRYDKARHEYRHLSKPGPSGLYLAQFFETGQETIPIPGVIPIGRAQAAEALEWEATDFDAKFAELESSGIAVADWKARIVFLPAKLQETESAPNSLNAVVTYRRAFDKLEDCDLKARIGEALREIIARRSDLPSWLEAWDGGKKPSRKAMGEPTQEGAGEASGVQRTGNREQKTKKPPSSAMSRLFEGQQLRVSQSQHEIVSGALGPSASIVDFQQLYAAADADYIRNGEPRDVLADLKRRGRDAAGRERIRLDRERERAQDAERRAEDARLEAEAAERRERKALATQTGDVD